MKDVLMDGVGFVANNWDWIATAGAAIASGYAIKVKKTMNSVSQLIDEANDVLRVKKRAMEDMVITDAEKDEIVKESIEAIDKFFELVVNIQSILPDKLKSKIPVKFGSKT